MVALLDGFQERRAQRGREDQRDDHRQRHRRGDGDRELPVDDAGRPAEEGHRQEHRGQHHRDADQRAGDLGHRLARGLLRRQAFLGHHALHVLHDDDGVVDQQADRQHDAEHGQRVDREAGGGEHPEGPEQHDRHRDRRDEGRSQVLQEEIHDEEDEHDRFEQRNDDFLDGQADERRRVVRIDDVEAWRELRAQALERRPHGVRRVERVGAGGQPDRDGRSPACRCTAC